jgi:hypothetical protein
MVYNTNPPSGTHGVGFSSFGDTPSLDSLRQKLYQDLIATQKNGVNLKNKMDDAVAQIKADYDEINKYYPNASGVLQGYVDHFTEIYTSPMFLGKSGEELGQIDNAYEEFHNHYQDFLNDPNAQKILKDSGFFGQIDLTNPQNFNAIEDAYSKNGSPPPSTFFNNLNNTFTSNFNDLMNYVGNGHPP